MLILWLCLEFEDTRKGVLFGRPNYDTVKEVKKSIINEEIVLATMKDTDGHG